MAVLRSSLYCSGSLLMCFVWQPSSNCLFVVVSDYRTLFCFASTRHSYYGTLWRRKVGGRGIYSDIIIVSKETALGVAVLDHGCARVAHRVTAPWCNCPHYCRPLRQYDVWFTCSEHTEALTGAPTADGVHKQEFTLRGGSTWMGEWKRFPSVSWFAHPCSRLCCCVLLRVNVLFEYLFSH